MSSALKLYLIRPNHQNRKEKDRKAQRIKHWGNMKRFERMRKERQRNKKEAKQMRRRERRRGLKFLHDGSSKPKTQKNQKHITMTNDY